MKSSSSCVCFALLTHCRHLEELLDGSISSQSAAEKSQQKIQIQAEQKIQDARETSEEVSSADEPLSG